jgi:hypothetical protein
MVSPDFRMICIHTLFIISLFVGCNQSQIVITTNSIIFKFDNNIKSVAYTNKDNPITHITKEGKGVEYDIPYLVDHNNGIILVHDEIPYEGIESAITIYNSKGDILKRLPEKPGYVTVSPNGHSFVIIEQPFVDFTGQVYFYNFKGDLIKEYRFSEYGPESGNARFSDNSEFFIVDNGGGWQDVQCKYIIFSVSSENYAEINLPDDFCGDHTIFIFNSEIFITIAKDVKMNINNLYAYYPDGKLIGKSYLNQSDIDKLIIIKNGDYKVGIHKQDLIIKDQKGNKLSFQIL